MAWGNRHYSWTIRNRCAKNGQLARLRHRRRGGRRESSIAGLTIHRPLSRDIPEADRLEAYDAFFRDPAIGFDFDPLDARPVINDYSVAVLPDLRIGEGECDGYRIDRTASRIATDGKADFALMVHLSGSFLYRDSRREVALTGGNAVLATDTIPTSIVYEGGRPLVMQPSRAALASRVPDIDDYVGREIPANSAALAMLRIYAVQARASGVLETEQGSALARSHLLDLIALTVTGNGEGVAETCGRGLAAGRLAAIKHDIGRHLDDPDLGIDAVAGRQGISPRYIARLFAGEATSFTDYIRAGRLERARAVLANPRCDMLRIADIAYDSGFNDISWFSRCFREKYGMPPAAYRRGLSAE